MKRKISQTIPEILSFDIPTIKNVPHTNAKDQCYFLNRPRILEYGAVRNITQVRRNFRKHFYPAQLNNVPKYNAFKRIVDRFLSTEGELRPVAKNRGTESIITATSWWKGQRVICRHMDHPCPEKSPDLSPLDYWFCSVAIRELTRVPPSYIEGLKTTDSPDTEEVLKAVGNIRKIAQSWEL